MDTDDNPKADVKKPTVLTNRFKNIIGGIAVLAIAILAGLVFTQYEAGIPPAEAAPAIASQRFIRVSIAEPNPAIRMKSVSGHSRQAAAHGLDSLPMAAHGPWCGLDQRGQT